MAKANGKAKKDYMSDRRYLPCRAEPGMFRGEYLVYMEGYNPSRPGEVIEVQMLVDEHEVKGLAGEPQRRQPVSAWVAVSLAHAAKGLAEVILPQPAQPVGTSMVVDAKQLKKEKEVPE